MVLLHDAVSMEWSDIYMDKYICDDMLEYEVSTRAHEWPYEMDTMVNVIPGEKRASLLSTDRLVNSSCKLRVVCASRGWSVELRHETSQTYQFGHIKETREWILNKTTSTLGLSYEGSSKKRKNTYLWTRCGSGCCILEHIYDLFLGVVSIWEMMREMNFIRSGDISRLRFAILKVLTLTNL